MSTFTPLALSAAEKSVTVQKQNYTQVKGAAAPKYPSILPYGGAHATKGPTKGLKYPRYEYLVDTDRLNLSRTSEMMSIL